MQVCNFYRGSRIENHKFFQLRNESEKLNEQIKKNRMELNVERPISVQQIPHIHIQTEQTENYTNFDLLNKQRNIRKRPFLVSFWSPFSVNGPIDRDYR